MAKPSGKIKPKRSADDKRAPILLLFDVDGTLTKSRLTVEKFMWDTLVEAKSKVYVGIVGGSDLPKQQEQLSGPNAGKITDFFDFVFSENGLVAFHEGKEINDWDLLKELGEQEIQDFVNFCMHYIADLKLPKKRGTFVEFRTGMINVCPIGRNCSQAERLEFFDYDTKHEIRATMIKVFEEKMPALAKKLKSSIGGQISYDVFPHGWDKTYCLQFLENMDFKEIHFFGDKAYPGGNDYELYEHKGTIGHKVTQPQDTVKLIREILDGLDKK